MTKPSIYSVGGTVQASDGLYLTRKADEELLQLCRAGNFMRMCCLRVRLENLV